MDVEVIRTISKEAIEQFERIRAAGPCNMMDRRCVRAYAAAMGCYDLVSLTRSEYLTLLTNYEALMEHYGIERQ